MPFASPYCSPEVIAAAGIAPCVVIRFTANKTVNITTAATQEPLGVTAEWSYDPPGAPGSPSANVVPTGAPVPYYSRGMMALCLVGSGGVTGGTRVMSNSTGGVITATTTNYSVGWANDTASAGEYVNVWVDPSYVA